MEGEGLNLSILLEGLSRKGLKQFEFELLELNGNCVEAKEN